MNCHATSTLAGDLAEVNAIKKVFKDTSGIKMNGTKARTLNPFHLSHFMEIWLSKLCSDQLNLDNEMVLF